MSPLCLYHSSDSSCLGKGYEEEEEEETKAEEKVQEKEEETEEVEVRRVYLINRGLVTPTMNLWEFCVYTQIIA